MIYGANGYTGELVARRAVERGHRPVLAGRNRAVMALAAELGLSGKVVDLRDHSALRRALADVTEARPSVGDLRGVGLAAGVEFVTDRSTTQPDGRRAREIRDRMRHLGVLVGTTGQHGNVLKIRPPLAFDESHVGTVADALDAALMQTD